MSLLKKNCCDGIYESSIDIRFTKLCDNRCSFCIEDMQGIESLGKTNVERLINSVKSGVEHEGKDTVLILGGEPFMFPKELCRFVSGIRDMVKKIYITTSLPKELNIYDPHVSFILQEIDGLNVSLHHWDWEKNNEILQATRKHNRIKQLEEIAFWHDDKIRLQCNLVKGGIEDAMDVNKIMRLADKLYLGEVKFNELQDVGEDLYVSWDWLFPQHKLGNPYSTGCVTDVSKHSPFFTKMTVKRTCFMVNENSYHGANLLDLAKVIIKKFIPRKRTGANVIYENGLRSSGWISKEALIHKEKA